MLAITASAPPESSTHQPASAVSVWATRRRYAGDGRAHLYSKAQLADPRFKVIIPVCNYDEFYPARHDREMVSNDPQGGELCPACTRYRPAGGSNLPVQRQREQVQS